MINDAQTIAQTIETMVRRLVERFDPDQIILFGSHARGTAGPDSDVDLLVVLPVSGSKGAKQVEMRLALHDIHVPKDIIVVTPDEVARRRDVVGTIVRRHCGKARCCMFEANEEAMQVVRQWIQKAENDLLRHRHALSWRL